jgi:hypothetical protein
MSLGTILRTSMPTVETRASASVRIALPQGVR